MSCYTARRADSSLGFCRLYRRGNPPKTSMRLPMAGAQGAREAWRRHKKPPRRAVLVSRGRGLQTVLGLELAATAVQRPVGVAVGLLGPSTISSSEAWKAMLLSKSGAIGL